MKLAELDRAKVAVWGTGSEGLAALQALRERFPEKKLTVLEEAATLPEVVRADGLIDARLGAVTAARLGDFDVVIRSPGISIYREEIVQAKAAGVNFTSGTNLWFAENAAARTVCVTGSKGKSTTTHLIHHLLEAAGTRAKMVGNMGVPLLSSLDTSGPPTVYVVELSSYQLSDFTGAPTVGVVLNLYPEHLDWHHGEENYFRDKIRLLDRVTQARIINRQDQRLLALTAHLPGRVCFNTPKGFHHDGETVYRRDEPWISAKDWKLLGAHNLSNVCAALTALAACGVDLDKETARAALGGFEGLDHRLTRLGEKDGVLYVNDSIATIPQATLAALKVFEGRPTTLLVGGYDRGLNQQEFARLISDAAPFAVVTLPVTGGVLYRELCCLAEHAPVPTILHEAADLEKAVTIARKITPTGGAVLLSPGAPSFNSHRNFAERGEAFARAAGLPFRKRAVH